MGGIVEKEGQASLCAVSNEVPRKFVVEWHQIREGDWLLHDALVPEQWDWHKVLVTSPKTLGIWWEAGEILTGALERTNNIAFHLFCSTVNGRGQRDSQQPTIRSYKNLLDNHSQKPRGLCPP